MFRIKAVEGMVEEVTKLPVREFLQPLILAPAEIMECLTG